MRVVYGLGLVDILSAFSLGLLVLGYPIPHLQGIAALILIIKGSVFYNDILSIIDIGIGITMFVLLWVAPPILALSLAIYLCFKGLYTFT